jgi:hypothetical protein
MPIDDAAGRRAVREKRAPLVASDSVFTRRPKHTARVAAFPAMLLRDDVHQGGLRAVRKVLRSRRSSESAGSP